MKCTYLLLKYIINHNIIHYRRRRRLLVDVVVVMVVVDGGGDGGSSGGGGGVGGNRTTPCILDRRRRRRRISPLNGGPPSHRADPLYNPLSRLDLKQSAHTDLALHARCPFILIPAHDYNNRLLSGSLIVSWNSIVFCGAFIVSNSIFFQTIFWSVFVSIFHLHSV